MKIKTALEKIREHRYWIVLALLILSSFGYYAYYLKENQLFPEAALFFMKEVEIPKDGQNVLVFSPHPDDETVGAGGFIYESARKGDKVSIVLVTDGDKRGLSVKRYSEFEEATGLLGVKKENLTFLGYPDGGLQKEDQGEVKRKFSKIIDEENPDVIVYPFTKDQHLDHSTTGKILDEILEENKKIISYKYLVHHKRFPYPHLFRPDDYILPPVIFVNISQRWQKLMLSTEAEDQKMEALLKYKTQLRYISLRELLYSFVRKNEVFIAEERK